MHIQQQQVWLTPLSKCSWPTLCTVSERNSLCTFCDWRQVLLQQPWMLRSGIVESVGHLCLERPTAKGLSQRQQWRGDSGILNLYGELQRKKKSVSSQMNLTLRCLDYKEHSWDTDSSSKYWWFCDGSLWHSSAAGGLWVLTMTVLYSECFNVCIQQNANTTGVFVCRSHDFQQLNKPHSCCLRGVGPMWGVNLDDWVESLASVKQFSVNVIVMIDC